MKKIITLAIFAFAAIGMSACSASFSTGTNNTATNNTAKPTNAANNATNSGNANKANTSNSTSSTDSKKSEVKDEKANRPTDAKKQPNAPTIPAEWVYYADEARGYGFSLPKGSESGHDSSDGIDTFVGETPDKISIIVWAFKDKTMTKESLLDFAENALKELGETVTVGKLTGESEDYAVADADTTGKSGEKSKLKILVATDVTDNYVMIVRSDAASYDSKKATMDNIWGSFEMYSGGASGN